VNVAQCCWLKRCKHKYNGGSEEGRAAQHPQLMFIFSRDEGGTAGQQELCILTGIY